MSGVIATQRLKLEEVTEGERHITIGTAQQDRRYWLCGQEIFILGISDSCGINSNRVDAIIVFGFKAQETSAEVKPGQYQTALARELEPSERELYPEPTEIAVGLRPVETYPDRIIFVRNNKEKPYANM